MEFIFTPTMLIGAFGKGVISQAGGLALKHVVARASNPYAAANFTAVATDAILAVYAVDHPRNALIRAARIPIPIKNRRPPRRSTIEDLLKKQLGRKPSDAPGSHAKSVQESSGNRDESAALLRRHWLVPAALWLGDTLLQIAKSENDEQTLRRAGMPEPTEQNEWEAWLSRVVQQIGQRLINEANLEPLRKHLEFSQERADAAALVEPVHDLSQTVQGISRMFTEVTPLLRTVTLSLALLATIAVGMFPVVIVGGSSGRELGEIAAAAAAAILGIGPLWTRIGTLQQRAHINHLARDISATWQKLPDTSTQQSIEERPLARGNDNAGDRTARIQTDHKNTPLQRHEHELTEAGD